MMWPLTFLLLVPALAHAETHAWAVERYVQLYAAQYRIPPELIASLIDVESRWNPHALSNKGAMGLMQLMPATARRFGAMQPFDAEQNIAVGTRYVTTLMWEFHGDLRLVAAAYYASDRWVGQKQVNYRNHDVVACRCNRYAAWGNLSPRVERHPLKCGIDRGEGKAEERKNASCVDATRICRGDPAVSGCHRRGSDFASGARRDQWTSACGQEFP